MPSTTVDVAAWDRETKERLLVQLGFYPDLQALGQWPLSDDALNAFVVTALDGAARSEPSQ